MGMSKKLLSEAKTIADLAEHDRSEARKQVVWALSAFKTR